MAEIQPDVILLQEVNPLPDMAGDYVRALGEMGLQCAEMHQVDACGLRLAPGLAILPGLNNGLVVLAKTPLRVRKLEGLKLSGGIGGCRDHWGIQFGELRYASIAEVSSPATHMKYLVATMHLRSGIERDARVLHDLMEAHAQGRLHRDDQLMSELTRNQARRRMELHVLMQALQKLQTQEQCAGVIFGGDLNFELDSPEREELVRSGFTDTYRLAMPQETLSTYDPQNNPLAGHEEEALPSALTQAIAHLPSEDQTRNRGSVQPSHPHGATY